MPAKYVYDYMFHAQNLGQGFAASTMMLLTVAIIVVPWAYLEFGGGASVADTATLSRRRRRGIRSVDCSGPRGAKPRRDAVAAATSSLYGTLIVVAVYYLLPLYVMVVTSLKGMPEIRLGNIFSPPMEITFEPWVKAWADGLHRPQLRRPLARLLELGPHHRAVGDRSRSPSPRSTAMRWPTGASRARTSSSPS